MPPAWFQLSVASWHLLGVPGSVIWIQRDLLEAAAAVLGLLCFLEFVEG